MQKTKYSVAMGIPSLDSGVVSATRSMKTVIANIKVTDNPIRSPSGNGQGNTLEFQRNKPNKILR